jgi:hypothetical protein
MKSRAGVLARAANLEVLDMPALETKGGGWTLQMEEKKKKTTANAAATGGLMENSGG